MTATEVHEQKRYNLPDLPQEYVEIIRKKKCVNCKQLFDLRKNWNLEFAKSKSTIMWWHEPKVVNRGSYKTKQQCPK
jgi:hypothetical protein